MQLTAQGIVVGTRCVLLPWRLLRHTACAYYFTVAYTEWGRAVFHWRSAQHAVRETQSKYRLGFVGDCSKILDRFHERFGDIRVEQENRVWRAP